MHILPILSLAETAVNTLSNLFSDTGGERASPDSGKESGFSDIYSRYQAIFGEGEQKAADISLKERAVFAGEEAAPRRSYEDHASNADVAGQTAQMSPSPETENFSRQEEHHYTPLEQAPYTAHSTNGVLYEVGEVGFTQQELSELRDSLLKEGLPPETLTMLEQLASHPHGATLGQLLALLHGNALDKPSLSNNDKLNLQSFTDKIDSSGNLGKQILSLLENGQSLNAWNTLRNAMSEVDTVTLLAEDVAALGKAFNLSKNTLGKILAQFGGSDGLLLSPDVFNTLMVPVQQELQNRDGGKEKLAKALESRLQPLIAKARSRAESERKAAGQIDRKTQQSEILIRDKFMSKFNNEVGGVEKDDYRFGNESAEAKKNGQRFGDDESAQMKKDASSLGNEPANAEKNASRFDVSGKKNTPAEAVGLRTEETPTPKKNAPAQEPSAGAEPGERQKNLYRVREDSLPDGNTRDRDTKRDNAKESMFARIEVRQGRQTDATPFSPAFGAQFNAQGGKAAGAQGGTQSGVSDPLAGRVLQQVEQGFVSALNNGGRKLELQLTPGELGGVTLILTSGKGGEISALIRSERSETAELMARHLDVIRTNMEQQGIKVDKLEVQNQSLNNQEQRWQGTDQHNAMREEQERRDNLERLRRLGRPVDTGVAPAQDMQNVPHPAEISGHGLHLVA